VNDGRVHGRVAIGRGDTIQIGTESFRFHADVEPSDPPKVLAEVPSLQTTAAIVAVKRPPPGPAQAGVPATTSRRPGTLAALEILNPGPTRGTRFDLVAPLSHVGRGSYNDVVIADESVSDAHAKIQRRESEWWIVDMDSTNGTYVNGARIFGEAPLGRDADVRFGGVKMSFRTVGGVQRMTGETRVIVGLRAPDPQRASARDSSPAHPSGSTSTEARPSRAPILAGIALAALAATFVYLVLQGR
jgi:pSer/pThr/pTyr-binding forkhead associated (FHA) protein